MTRSGLDRRTVLTAMGAGGMLAPGLVLAQAAGGPERRPAQAEAREMGAPEEGSRGSRSRSSMTYRPGRRRTSAT